MRRASTGVLVLAAMLAASPLAMAQRASLADRVSALEVRAAGDQNGTELVNQIAQLRAEVQALRGQLEEAQQALAAEPWRYRTSSMRAAGWCRVCLLPWERGPRG